MLLSRLLKRIVRVGTLTVIDASGERHVFSGRPGPEATVRLHDRALHYKLLVNPYLYLGEAYMDGTLTIEKGTLPDFLEIATANMEFGQSLPLFSVFERLGWLRRRIQQYNPSAGRGPTSPTTTTCRTGCTTCSSIMSGNIPAHISGRRMTPWKPRSLTNSAIWPRSCFLNRARKFSTSARDGAGWHSSWRAPGAGRSQGSPCRRNS